MADEAVGHATGCVTPQQGRLWAGLPAVRPPLDAFGADTLVVIPHGLDSAERERWLQSALASVPGWRVHVAADQYRCGPASAILRAEQALGAFPDYVFVLDEAGVAMPGAITKMRAALQAGCAPFVCCDFSAERDGLEDVDYPRVRYPTRATLKYGWGHCGLVGYYWPMVYRIGGINATIRCLESFDLARRLAFAYGDPAYIPEKLVRCRLHEDPSTDQARSDGSGSASALLAWLMQRPQD